MCVRRSCDLLKLPLVHYDSSTDHLTYHVTMPAQPMCSYFEGILKLSAPVQVTIISPANGAQILAIPFDRIRRFGCEVIADFDLVWFETCGCKGFPEQFYYFSVPSGIEVAHIIVQEIKRNIELRIRSFLIQEEGDKERCQTTYISRSHYGCGEYPAGTRQGIIQTGLVSIAASPGRTEGSRQLSMISRMRRTSDFSGMPTPGYNDQRRQSTEKRRNTLADLQGGTPTQLAPSPSPRGTPSPTHSPGSSGQRMTLSQFGKRPPSSYANSRIGNGLSNSAGKGEFDSGVQLGAFDPSRHSAPSYYTVSDLPKDKTTTLKDMPKRMSLDEAGKKSRLHRQKQTGSMMPSSRGDKRRVSDTRRDSANGSMGDLLEGGPSILEPDSQYNHLEPGSQYNHLEPDSQYNHLEPDSPYNHLSPVVSATAYSSKSLPGRSKKSTGYDLNSSFGGMSLQSVDRSRKQSKT